MSSLKEKRWRRYCGNRAFIDHQQTKGPGIGRPGSPDRVAMAKPPITRVLRSKSLGSGPVTYRHDAAVLPGRGQEGIEHLLRRQSLVAPARLKLPGGHDLGEGPD